MSIRMLVATAVAVGLTAVSAGEAAAQSRGGGHCAGGQSAMTATPGSQNPQSSSQSQLTQMRSAYSQPLQLAQMRVASLQQMRTAQMQTQLQANRAATTDTTAAKQKTVKQTATQD